MNTDSKGIVQDVHVKISPCEHVQVRTPKPVTEESGFKEDFQNTILHRDVPRLIVLIPIEDKFKGDQLY